ncbi:HNH endonuclease [Mycobacterium simiae]|uniref:HNH endonuclease n=1 Tax=Mycobacterium simiae TaxID=1784 RepID=A0A5B1BTC1_MYCSI|nr:HNH endonuclease signature motif containing protein [Mycobacterium simiae]KAA1251192.1 HNH endonuclease [Mycobacterium simiae]
MFERIVAQNEEWFERRYPATTAESAALVDRICAATRAENRATGERLAAIGELDVLRLQASGERESWGTDTWEAVSAEVAAALRISQGLASSYLHYSRALRNRLPKVGAMLLAGDISYATFQTMVYRTDLIDDNDVMALVDAELAVKVSRWPSMTRSRLSAYVDRVVARADRDAVRRRREQQAERELSIWDDGSGLTEVFGRLVSTDAYALDARLDALAATVCDGDPRTRNQRRADAMGALTGGAERLECRCGQPGCAAATTPVPRPVVIHVVADQASLNGSSPNPAAMVDREGLIPAELIAELADSARLRPLVHPADAASEPGYTPSRALADFVRCRDLTCRFPGCDRPALHTDIDHTIPYGDGGATHASNLKCLCRSHHLIKTFWGWRDKQLPDGTVIWTSPSGHTYVTAPGSALLFPSLCAPTGQVPSREPEGGADRCGDRTAMMPIRATTRAQNRAAYVAAERRQNQQARESVAAQQRPEEVPAAADDEPPPF